MTDNNEEESSLLELVGAIFVQVSRAYDVLVMLLPPETRAVVLNAHESGRLLGDPPILLKEAWDEVPKD